MITILPETRECYRKLAKSQPEPAGENVGLGHQHATTWIVITIQVVAAVSWTKRYWVTVSGPSKTVRLMTSVFAWCGPCFTPLGAKKKAPVV